MLKLAFKVATYIEQKVASADQRQAAMLRTHGALQRYGARAVDATLHELRYERRRNNRRVLRLAVAQLIADRFIVVPIGSLDERRH